ncbi:Hsp20/alpha crystallin family protein [Cytophagales bacterium RKSG123]|nr:Hsp20/alpha crystallin family protein [Xanthovirga aplysinae]
MPAVNIKESEKEYHVEVAAPGLKKDDFKIDVDEEGDVLMISSEHQATSEEKSKAGDYRRKEFSYESFQRSFNLPEHVKADKITANYNDGVLDICIPKTDQKLRKTIKHINIK